MLAATTGWLGRQAASRTAVSMSSNRSSSVTPRGDVLVVVHGEGRGRALEILPMVEANLAATRPSLRPRVRIHATGSQRPRLDGVVAILFLLSDPLKENYPACYAEALEIAAEGRELGAKLLNPPESLSNSVKSRQAALWKSAGLPCAAARSLRSPADLEPAMAALGLPLIVRSDDSHVQRAVRVCKRPKHVDDAKAGLVLPAVALQLIDVRARWREAAPGSLMARYHHKKRSMVYGDTVLNNHVYFSSSPIVGLATSTFVADRRRWRRGLRALGIGRRRWEETLAADREYFDAPPEAPETMLGAVAALGLHVAAIDYASLPDGGVVLWEANPYVHLPPWHHSVLAEPRGIRERTARHVEGFTRWLERLANGEARDGAAQAARRDASSRAL